VKISEVPAKIRRPSPQAGEHTIEVLKELGYADKEIRVIQNTRIV